MIFLDNFKILIYLLVSGISWSLFFNKKFTESLAPSLIFHTIFVTISGMIFNDLRFGFYTINIAYISIFIYQFVFKKAYKDNRRLEKICNGLIIFILFYIILAIFNIGKYIRHFDEFSHWGMFIKETFRLDKFFYLSDLSFSHKDYVSSTTTFMYIILKIVGRYDESYCNTAMTILMYSMIIPIYSFADKLNKGKKISFDYYFIVLILFFIPILTFSGDNFYFYRGIMPDYALGVCTFYCIYLVYRNENNIKYSTFVITLSLSLLALVKMIGIAYVFIIYLYYLIKNYKNLNKLVLYIPIMFVVLLWYAIDKYIGCYINTSGIQSYASITFNDVINVITLDTNKISYIRDLLVKYMHGLFSKDVLIQGSYITSMVFIIILLIICAILYKDKIKIILLTLWMLFAYVYNAILYFFLYATRFSKNEALGLAAFSRYMGTFVTATVYILIMVFVFTICEGRHKFLKHAIYLSVSLMIFYNIFVAVKCVVGYQYNKLEHSFDELRRNKQVWAVYQYVPSQLTNEYKPLKNMKELADKLTKYKNDNKRVIILCNDRETFSVAHYVQLYYYLDYKNIYSKFAEEYDSVDAINNEIMKNDAVVIFYDSSQLKGKYNGLIIKDEDIYNFNVVEIAK